MRASNLAHLQRAAEADTIKAANFAAAFHDFLDSTMYPGYVEELAESNPEAYYFEFSQFLKNYGDDSGEVLEPCQA